MKASIHLKNHSNTVCSRKLISNMLFSSLLLYSSITSADSRPSDKNWYVGGSIGQSSLEPNASNSNWVVTDKKDVSKKVFVGKNLNNQIGLEAFWTNLGDATLNSTTGGGEGKINYSGYGAHVVYNSPYVMGNFRPFGKLGIAKFKTKDKGAASSKQMNKTSVVGALGVDYEITEQLSLRTEFDYYDKDAKDLNIGFKWSPTLQSQQHNRVQVPTKVTKAPETPKIVYKEAKPKIVYVPKKVYVPTPVVSKPAPIKPQIQTFRRDLSGGSNFDTASSELTYKGKNTLDRLVSDINSQRVNIKAINVVGHTDSVGNHHSNNLLSINRALSVANYLSARGINRSLITTIGKGETQPIADNKYKEGRAKNRRVEITINGTSTKLVSN